MDQEIHLCDYGCGKIAIKQFKNGKWCCSEKYSMCDGYRLKRSDIQKRKKGITKRINIPKEVVTDKLCDYGCRTLAKYQFTNGKFCCEISQNKCLNVKIKTSRKGKDNSLYEKTYEDIYR